MSPKKNALIWVIALAAVLTASYWYWSPHVTLYEMTNAARERDADALNDHIDYARFRESIKDQLVVGEDG